MRTTFRLFAAATVCATCQANAAWFTDESEFLAAIDPVFYLEDFNDFQYGVQLDGSQTSWAAPGANGYGWDASAAQGLWSNDGSISTAVAEDTLGVTFTGNPVSGVGGIFFATDISGSIVLNSEITVRLSNGESHSIISDGFEFLGWTGVAPISGMEMNVALGSATWASIDHFYVGNGVPEPTGWLVLGIGLACLAALRMRR
jgi:hypothetical protein